MKMNTEFTTTMRLKTIDKDGQEIVKDEEFSINETEAENFLFCFTAKHFKVNEYYVKIIYHEDHTLIYLEDEDKTTWIVMNRGQVFNDILNGYLMLRTMDKFSSIINFDYEAALDLLCTPVDEFEEAEKKEE